MPGIMRLAALLALAASVAAIGGCGSNDVKGTIPASDAAQLNADLDAIQASTTGGDCAAAQASAQDFVDHVNLLPSTAGSDLKDALRDAGDNLEQQLQQQCAAGATGATGQQPASPERSSTKETNTTSTPTTTDSTTTTTPAAPAGPPGNGNGNANGIGNGQGNGNSGVGSPGGGNPGGGSTGGTGGGTGGTGIRGD